MARPRPDLSFELAHKREGRAAVGVDEVGRGCLAGPVVAAAVLLPDFIYERAPGSSSQEWWLELNDSKLVSPSKREALSLKIHEHARVSIAWCTPDEIDRYNILRASLMAMRKALEAFAGRAPAVLVDGHIDPFQERFGCKPGERERCGFSHVETIVKGDSRSMSIAAASIVAKVYRDKWMGELDLAYPGYSFAEHKGYSTPTHYRAIEKLGPSPIHRLSFAPFT